MVIFAINRTSLCLAYSVSSNSCETPRLMYPDCHPWSAAPEYVHVHPDSICERHRARTIDSRSGFVSRWQFKYHQTFGSFDSQCHLLLAGFTIDKESGVIPQTSILWSSSSRYHFLRCIFTMVLELPALSGQRRDSDASLRWLVERCFRTA